MSQEEEEEEHRAFKAGLDGRTARRDGRMVDLRKRRQDKLEKKRKKGSKDVSASILRQMVENLDRNKSDFVQYVTKLREILGQGAEATPYFDTIFHDPRIIATLVNTLGQPLTESNIDMMCSVASCVANISAHVTCNEWVPVLLKHGLMTVLSNHLSAKHYTHTDFYDSLIMTVGNICFDTVEARKLIFYEGIITLLALHFNDNIELYPVLIGCFNSLFRFKPVPTPSAIGEFWSKIRPIVYQSNAQALFETVSSIHTMVAQHEYKQLFITDVQLLTQLITLVKNPNTNWESLREIMYIFNILTLVDLQYMIEQYNVIDMYGHCIMHSNPNVVERAAFGLASCANDEGLNYKILCSPHIMDNIKSLMVRNQVWRIKTQLIWTIGYIFQNATLNNDADTVRELCASGMLFHFENGLSTLNDKLRHHILLTTKLMLLKFPFVNDYLEDAGILGAIEEYAMTHDNECARIAERILQIIDGKSLDMELEEEEEVVPDLYHF